LRLGHSAAWARDEVLLLGMVSRQADTAAFTMLPTPLSSEVIAIAFPRDAELQRLVDDALTRLGREGRLEALYDQWFMKPNAATKVALKLPPSPELKRAFARSR
jgi:glutamate/aspartate transport system substrate-binding protein